MGGVEREAPRCQGGEREAARRRTDCPQPTFESDPEEKQRGAEQKAEEAPVEYVAEKEEARERHESGRRLATIKEIIQLSKA